MAETLKFKKKIDCEVEVDITSDEFAEAANKLNALDRWWVIRFLMEHISDKDIEDLVAFTGKKGVMEGMATYLSAKGSEFLRVILHAPEREEDQKEST